MQQKFITSWYLVLFFLSETPFFSTRVGKRMLLLLKRIRWTSKRAIAYGNLRTPVGFFSPYRKYQRWQLCRINKKLAASAHGALTLDSIGRAFILKKLERYAVRVSMRGGKLITLRAIAEHDDQYFMFCKRTINLDKKLARHDYLVIGEHFKGSDNLARLLENSNAFYKQVGVKRIELTAGLSMGGSFWPKLGFVPQQSEWSKLRKHVEKNLRKMPEALARKFYEKQGIELRDAVASIFDSGDSLNIDALRELSVGNSIDDKIGIKLLMGSRWKGFLMLDDVARAGMFFDYIEARKLDADKKRALSQNGQQPHAIAQP